MPLTILRTDITTLRVDAIVNAANPSLRMGGGVCGAIFTAAGADTLHKACEKLAPIQPGAAVLTKGFALPAKYIIHTPGPVYRDGRHGEAAVLRACYTSALTLAQAHNCKSIAFPLLASGAYSYPKDEALAAATSAIKDWLRDGDMEVLLAVFDKAAFTLSKELHGEIQSFIDESEVNKQQAVFGRSRRVFTKEKTSAAEMDASAFVMEESAPIAARVQETTAQAMLPSSLDSMVGRLDEPFSETLLRLIDAKGKTDVEVYKRANLDRKLFSKIRTGKHYMPSKKTALALAVALELSLAETQDLLSRAGFTLSRSVAADVILEYFITRQKYDIFEINNALFSYDQPLLGG